MANITHLTNAPIKEVIIDLKIEPTKEFPLDRLSELVEEMKSAYPSHERRNLFEGEFHIVPSEQRVIQSTKEMGLHGYFFKSEDGRKIAQFRVDGFTFNRLKPYTSWDTISQEANRLWKLYLRIMTPEHVNRIAVRYINHFNLPLSTKELSQYLTTPPQIPDDLPKNISGFLTRMTMVDEKTNIMANVTLVLEQSIDPKYIPIIFDIDVFKKELFESNAIDIQNVLKDLRDMKNRIFFSYITENTVGLFK